MELSLLLGQRILSMFLIMIIGWWMTSSKRFSAADTDALARININIICPCAIFASFQLEFSMERLTGLAVAALAAVLVHILFIAAARILRPMLRLTPAETCSAIYSNSLNLIYPIVSATLGTEMIFYCSAYMLVQTFLLWTHGLMVISGSKNVRLRSMLNINVIAVIAGLCFYLLRLQLPRIPADTITNIGNCVGPASMMVIGMLLGPMDLKKVFCVPRVYLVASLRLLVMPMASVLFLRFSGLMQLHPNAKEIFLVTVIASASCTAATVPQQAQLYGNEGNYASLLNVMTLAFCIVTMPLIVLVYQLLL